MYLSHTLCLPFGLFLSSVTPLFHFNMAFILSSFLLASLLVTGGANAADAEDPYDLSFYTKGAAIGDS
jgi:hypothetical protein